MCDVMPSIAETGREADLRDSVCSDIDEEHDYDISGGHGDDGLLLDEKEELVESLREAQDNLASTQASLQRLEHERDSLYARLFTSQPVVRTTCHLLTCTLVTSPASPLYVPHVTYLLVRSSLHQPAHCTYHMSLTYL